MLVSAAAPSGDDQIAYNLDIRTRANGSVEVAIDSGEKFSLGPRLAEVFRFLASGDKERGGNDGLSAGGHERRSTSFSTTRRASNFAPAMSTIWFICCECAEQGAL